TFAQLLARQRRSYGCAVGDVREGFINSATVAGTDALLGTTVTDADAAKVRLDETQTCPTDMLAYWKLDESGGTVFDDFYYGHDGQCVLGSCPGSTAGLLNGAQQFDGSDKIDVPVVPGDNSFDWGVDDSFSIEFWMQTDGGSTCAGNEVVIGRADGARWWVGCETGGNALFYLRDEDQNVASVAGTAVAGGAWHHVVAVQDAAAEAIRIYVDGTLRNSVSTYYTAGFGASTGLNIGWFNSGSGYHFDGVVDELALYNRALSSSEVEQHYAEGLAGRWLCQTGTYPPVIVSTPVTEAAVGWPYSYDVQAAGNPAPTYALTTSPDGMTIDPATGLISWTPTLGQEGSHPVEVEASNSQGSDSQPFTVVVGEGTICPDDMLAYWKLDETSGPSYEDFYDAHDGQCVAGACPSPTAGYVNGGQEFNGSNDRVNVPADTVFDWGVFDSFSIAFWMQTDSGSTCDGNEVVIGRADGARWWVGCATGGNAYFVLRDGNGNTASVAGTAVTGGAWHHVVAVQDAAAEAIRIYVDGTLRNSVSTYYTAGFSASTGLNIGWYNSGGGYHFDGVVDELALYNRALTATEIQQHYDNGRVGGAYCVNPAIAINKTANPPVAYVGDTVIYTFSVTNPGDGPLLVTTPSDDKCSSVSPTGGDDDGDSRLDSSETWTYQCSMDLMADTTNEATVLGSHFLGGTVSDTVSLFVDVISPAITLQKAANPEAVYAGEPVTYTYTVANPGNDPLWIGANVSDDKCSPIEFVSGNDNDNDTLDPGEVWTYICSTAVSTDITNTATVTGTDSAGGTWSVTDSVFVDVRDSTLTIVKEADDDDAAFGFTMTYDGYSEPFSLKNGESRQFTQLASGSYTIAEAVTAGWKLGSIVCDNGISIDAPTTPAVTVDLGARQDVSCRFTNIKASYPVYLPMILRNRH
ncbi:MAG: putative Ig domain-containing protein, partial [Anaerolineae bacterium]